MNTVRRFNKPKVTEFGPEVVAFMELEVVLYLLSFPENCMYTGFMAVFFFVHFFMIGIGKRKLRYRGQSRAVKLFAVLD